MAHYLDYKNPPNYSTYRRRADEKFKGDAVLTKEQFQELSSHECHYCGKDGPNGIDRVDNSIGYTFENCVPCCKHCNYVKGDLSLADFDEWRKRFIAKQTKTDMS